MWFKGGSKNLMNPEVNDKNVKRTRTPLLLPDIGFCLEDKWLLGSLTEL